MSNKNDSKVTFRTIIQQLLAGMDKHFAGKALTINGVSVKPDDLAAKWDAYLAAVADADATRALWLGKIDAANKLEPEIRAEVNAAHDFVRGTFGAASATLDDFGMTPRRPAAVKRTVASKAEAIEKSLATRVVRHTLGSKQKAALHASAPTATPAAPAAAATPTVVKPGSGQS